MKEEDVCVVRGGVVRGGVMRGGGGGAGGGITLACDRL